MDEAAARILRLGPHSAAVIGINASALIEAGVVGCAVPFQEAFVRPAGLDRSATPAAVDAIEALAAEKGR